MKGEGMQSRRGASLRVTPTWPELRSYAWSQMTDPSLLPSMLPSLFLTMAARLPALPLGDKVSPRWLLFVVISRQWWDHSSEPPDFNYLAFWRILVGQCL